MRGEGVLHARQLDGPDNRRGLTVRLEKRGPPLAPDLPQEISTIGGWSQLFSTPYGSASVLTADVAGHHQRELKQGTSLFWSSAKRSTVCGPKPRSVESNCCLESE